MRLDLDLIDQAHEALEGRVRRTPVEPSVELERRLGVPVSLKLECLQVTGSFKVRGALFRLGLLTDEERAAGVVCCSAGNHGLGIAHAAFALRVPSRVYLPASVEETRSRRITDLGGEVVRSPFPGYDDTLEWAREREGTSGRTWILADEDPGVMAGNGGTLALEVLEQVPDAGVFVVPAGGCGLAAGFSLVSTGRRPGSRLVCCQHEGSPALALSLERGRPVTRLPAIETAAGGIEGGLAAGCFEVLRDRVDSVALVSEEEIFAAVRWMLETHRYLIEPSSAVVVAAALAGRLGRLTEPAVLVLSGRNAEPSVLARLFSR